MRVAIGLWSLAAAWLGGAASLRAQVMPGGVCRPVAERGPSPTGCWILTHVETEVPAREAWWYIDAFADSASAERARVPNSTVRMVLGRALRLTIGDADGPATAGERVARVGPLVLTPGVRYMAQYMEATFPPGMASTSHFHPGIEAIVTFTGETCAETPQGVLRGRGGGAPLIVPPDTPMHVTATGPETRRSVVLILHDASQPASMPKRDFVPTGRCTAAR